MPVGDGRMGYRSGARGSDWTSTEVFGGVADGGGTESGATVASATGVS